MTLTIEVAPEEEQALAAKARRNGQTVNEYLRDLVKRDVEVVEVETLYAESLATDGDLTASTRIQEDVHEYSPDELATMEAGLFERPLR
jgi:predicted DNA-binding protein